MVLNVGGFGFAAYQCEQNPILDKRVAEIPLFGSAVGVTKGLMRSMGVTKGPAIIADFADKKNGSDVAEAAAPVVAKKKEKHTSDAKKNMKALIEASRVKKEKGGSKEAVVEEMVDRRGGDDEAEQRTTPHSDKDIEGSPDSN